MESDRIMQAKITPKDMQKFALLFLIIALLSTAIVGLVSTIVGYNKDIPIAFLFGQMFLFIIVNILVSIKMTDKGLSSKESIE